MPRFKVGVVSELVETREGLMRVLVKHIDGERPASVFTKVTGGVEVGDRVAVNTTGIDLGLGSGGEDFVLWNLEKDEAGEMSGGHILKLRYTPWQIDTLVAEAPESPHHDLLSAATSIEGMPVIACGLHSQLTPSAAVIKHLRPEAKIAYVMSDGAALSMAHSDSVAELKKKAVIDSTVTFGHAFGGDYEAINIFTGLLTAKFPAGCDVAIVAMGPGIVGSGTALGHTEMEQGQTVSAAAALQGRPVAALRISFADERERHRGVSHHSINALRVAARDKGVVGVPRIDKNRLQLLVDALDAEGISKRHEVIVVEEDTEAALAAFDLHPVSMGRSFNEDPEYFRAAGAAGTLAVQMLEGTL